MDGRCRCLWTPDGEPFFGGTYFPARTGDRGATPGFLTIVQRVQQAWSEKRDLIKKDAGRLTAATRSELDGRRNQAAGEIRAAWVDECILGLSQRFDSVHGGFGFSEQDPQRPKFPEASNLFFCWTF